jgi:hypothetical protein
MGRDDAEILEGVRASEAHQLNQGRKITSHAAIESEQCLGIIPAMNNLFGDQPRK